MRRLKSVATTTPLGMTRFSTKVLFTQLEDNYVEDQETSPPSPGLKVTVSIKCTNYPQLSTHPEFCKEVLRHAREGGLVEQLIDAAADMGWTLDERIHLDFEIGFWDLHPCGVRGRSTSADLGDNQRMLITGQVVFLDRPIAGDESA